MRTIVFDFETIPNEQLVKNKDAIRKTLRPPANYKKTEVIEGWKDEQMELVEGNMALHPLTGRICAAGFIILEGNTEVKRDCIMLEKSTDEAEKTLLTEFTENIEDYRRIIGFNSKKFDAHFYRVRSQITGVKPVGMNTNPYDSSDHVDLMNALGMPIQLEQFRIWYGISKGTESLGAQVYGLWKEGKKDEIKQHCLDDIDSTLKLAQLLNYVPKDIVTKEAFA